MKRALIWMWTTLIIFLTGVQTCYAHHLWVFEETGSLVVARGHMPERIDDYDPHNVSEIKGFDQAGAPVSLERKDEASRAAVFPDKPVSIVSVCCEWGDRVNTTRGKKLMNRQAAEAAGLTVVSAFTSTQFSKTLFAPSEISTHSLGLRFELVPNADPMALAPGAPISFKLLFDGRPLAGVSISTNFERESKTDANGVAEFTFEKSGVHLLYATHKIPAEENSGLDFLKFMTFLTFEVK